MDEPGPGEPSSVADDIAFGVESLPAECPSERGGGGCATIAVLVENVYLMLRLDGDGKIVIVYGFAAEFAPSHNTHRVEPCIVAFNGPKPTISKLNGTTKM